MKIGDFVVRKSYNKDLKFKIVDIKEFENKKVFILKGYSIRIIADSLGDDLEVLKDARDEFKDLLNSKAVRKRLKKKI